MAEISECMFTKEDSCSLEVPSPKGFEEIKNWVQTDDEQIIVCKVKTIHELEKTICYKEQIIRMWRARTKGRAPWWLASIRRGMRLPGSAQHRTLRISFMRRLAPSKRVSMATE